MVKQYPHTISFLPASAGTQNETGDWIPGSGSATTPTQCRFEPSSGNAFFKGQDGQNIYFNGIVYLPLPVDNIAPGAIAEVKDGSIVLSKSKVLRFSAGQLNARIWL